MANVFFAVMVPLLNRIVLKMVLSVSSVVVDLACNITFVPASMLPAWFNILSFSNLAKVSLQ